jgi:O-acetyl-ADP-ribose deacetylase
MTKLNLVLGDITKTETDAIVNAANSSLLGGGGVDGAIHRAAGPELLAACKTLAGCETGQAKITLGYRLPAKYVIHTVGPVWNRGKGNEKQLLYDAYYNSLSIALSQGIRTLAFPNISTGVYAFPKELAVTIAVNAVEDFVRNHPGGIDEITFVCYDSENYDLYSQMKQINKHD